MNLLPKADALAHVLYAPTMLGRRSARARWHHRIHLIPGALLRWVCNRYEDRLLIGSARTAIEEALIASEQERWGDVPDRVAIAQWADEIHRRLLAGGHIAQ